MSNAARHWTWRFSDWLLVAGAFALLVSGCSSTTATCLHQKPAPTGGVSWVYEKCDSR